MVASTQQIQFVVLTKHTNFTDQPVPGTFSLSRKEGDDDIWLAPDFGFWAWPEPGVGSYVGFRYKARQVEASIRGWAGKKKELFWRGATWIGEERRVRDAEAATLLLDDEAQ